MSGTNERPGSMKIIDILGDNRFDRWTDTRTACRAIVIREGRLLLSYEANTGQWMLPGGGLEGGESEAQCVVREVAEETGVAIRPGECALEIDEYYEEWKYISRYYPGEIIGSAQMRLTEREIEAGMEPRWMPVDESLEIFSKHQSWADVDEMRRGLYLREYTALTQILENGRDNRMPNVDKEPAFISLRDRPALKDAAAEWFHEKWGVPRAAYLERMEAYLSGASEYGWYLCLDGERIAGGLGVIENDFHDRKDLAPNICAVYTEADCRGRGIAGRLLDLAVEDLRAKGISPVYLLTNHVGFYEKYGWEYLCTARGDGEDGLSRIYIHR